MDRHDPPRSFPVCVLLALLTLAVFWPLLSYDFVNLDDNFYVTQNPRVLAGLTWENAAWAFKNTHYGNWYPLTLLSHMLDVQMFGLHAGGHHATNLLLHVCNTLLLFLVLSRMTRAF